MNQGVASSKQWTGAASKLKRSLSLWKGETSCFLLGKAEITGGSSSEDLNFLSVSYPRFYMWLNSRSGDVQTLLIVSVGLLITGVPVTRYLMPLWFYQCLIPRFLIYSNTCLGPHSELKQSSELHPYHLDTLVTSSEVFGIHKLPREHHTSEPNSRQLYFFCLPLMDQGKLSYRKIAIAET